MKPTVTVTLRLMAMKLKNNLKKIILAHFLSISRISISKQVSLIRRF